MRRIADAEQSFAAPIAQAINLHGEQFDLRPVVHLRHSVPQKTGEADDVILKLRQAACFDLLKAAFWNHETALPVIAAIEQHQQLALLEESERLLRIVFLLRNAHPEGVNRNSKFLQIETRARVNGRMPSVRADDEIGVEIKLATRGFCARAAQALPRDQ